jgi:hypothetical protein
MMRDREDTNQYQDRDTTRLRKNDALKSLSRIVLSRARIVVLRSRIVFCVFVVSSLGRRDHNKTKQNAKTRCENAKTQCKVAKVGCEHAIFNHVFAFSWSRSPEISDHYPFFHIFRYGVLGVSLIGFSL